MQDYCAILELSLLHEYIDTPNSYCLEAALIKLGTVKIFMKNEQRNRSYAIPQHTSRKRSLSFIRSIPPKHHDQQHSSRQHQQQQEQQQQNTQTVLVRYSFVIRQIVIVIVRFRRGR